MGNVAEICKRKDIKTDNEAILITFERKSNVDSSNQINYAKTGLPNDSTLSEEETNFVNGLKLFVCNTINLSEKEILLKFSLIQNRIRTFLFQKLFKEKIKPELVIHSQNTIKLHLEKFCSKAIISSELLYSPFELEGWKEYFPNELNKTNNPTFKSKIIKIFLLSNDNLYIGEGDIFGNKIGFGELYTKEGEKFQGNFQNNTLNGWGRYIDNKGCISEGIFKNDQIKLGILKNNTKSLLIKGEFLNNKPHGQGIEKRENEYEYIGDFFEGRKHGKGKINYFISGETYEGEFKDGFISGFGKYKWRNNESFEGPFEDGKINGVGTYKWADGFEYYGNYTNNTKEGDGIFKWPNGRTYKGPFKLGNPHGDGIMFEKNSEYSVKFSFGKLIKYEKSIKRDNNPIGLSPLLFDPMQSSIEFVSKKP